ncbi:hypothetical protein DUNSADRAFT_12680 [Dunaliella salina]|uniref:Uncharacterized protein n=1 Tax=Dunaliella salina TaxID=3046 RepID=A0ABQ7GAV0_DUNSA|nr:hypothetical protein DUNSADRAFT_12680 [Dunaliella salina]|eukprot:KAF5831733.1 hypothetical protein DUNSADRAFT_12680 [Dunaliella salina]
MLSPGAESTPQSSKPPPRLSWAGSRPKRGSLRRSRDDSIRIHNPFKDYESDEDEESISQRHASMATAGESRYTTSRIGRRLQAGGLAFFGYLRDEIMQQEERIQCKMKSSFAVNAPKVPQPSDAWVQAITRPQSRICESMGGSVRSTLTSRCSSDSIPQRSHHLSANGMPPHPGSVRAATAPHTTRARRDVHSAHASTAPLCLSRGLYGLAPARQEPAEPANLDAGAPDDFENAALSMAATPKPCPDQVPTSSSAPLGSQPATSTHPLAASAPCLSLSPSHTDQAFTPVTGTAEDHPQTSVKPPPTHMTQSVSGTIPARPSTAAAHAGMPGQMLANTKSSRASSARAPLPHSPFMGPALHSEPTFQHSPTSSHSGTGHAHHGSSGFGSAGRHARCVDGAVRTVEGLHQPVLDSSLVSTFPKRTTSAGPSPPGSPNFSPSRVRSRSSSPPSRPDSAAEDANTPHDEYHPWVKPGQFARFPERTACTGQPLDTPEAAATATVHAALESSFNNVSKTGHSFRKVPAHMSRVQGCTASGVGGGGGGGGDDVSRVHPNISPAAAHPITATAGSSTSSPGTAALRPSHQHPQHHVHPVQSANTTKTFVATSTMSQGGPEGGRIHRKSQESTVLAHSAQISGRESAAHTQSTQMLGQGSLLQPTPSHTVAPPDLRSLAASAKGATLSARSTHPHEHTPSRHSGSIHAGGPAPSAGPASIVAASEPDDDSSSHAHPLHPLGKKADAGPRRRARRASSPSGLSRHRTPTALSGMRLKGLKKCEADGCSSYRRRLSQALAIPFDTEDDGDVSDLAENASKGLSTYRSSLGTINSTGKGVAGADMRAECAQPAKHLCERSSTQEDVWISSSRSSGRVQEDRYGIRNSRAASSVDSQDEECGGPPIWMAGALSRLASPTAGQHSPGGSRSRHASPEKSGSRHGSPEKPGIQPQSPSSSMLASSMQSVGHGAPQLFDVTSHAVLPGATSATAQPALDLTHATPGAPTPHPPLLSNSTPPLLHTPPVSVSGHPAHVPHTPPPLPAPPTAHTSPSLAQPLGASSHSTGPSHHTLHLLPQLAPPAAVHQHPPLAVYHPTHQHLRVDSPSSPRAVALSQQQVSMPATAPYPLHQQPPQTAAASTEQLGSPPLQQSAAPAAHGEKQHRPRTLSPPPSSDQAHPLARSLANYNALPFVQGVHKTGGTQNSMQGGAEMAEQHQQQQQQQQQKDHTVLHPAQGAAAAAAATPPDTSDHDVGRPPIHAHTGLTPTSTPTKMAAGLVTKGLSRVASAATAPAASTTPVVTKGGLHSPSHMHSLRASPQSPRAPTQENTAQQNSALTEGPAHGDPRPSSLKPAHVPRLSLQSQQHQHPQQHHPQQQHQQLLTQHMRLQSAQQQHAKPLSLPYQKPAWRPSTAQPQPQTAQSAAAALAEMVSAHERW